MSNYNIICHSKGPWKDHKYKRIENGQYIYNDSSSSSASKPISKSEINSHEKRNESFTGNALYRTEKMGGPLKGVPYAQTAGGFYLYNNPNIRNGKGKYLVYKPDGSKLYINSLDEWKDLRNNKTSGSSSSSGSSEKKKKKATPAEQIEELKEDIGEIKDLELDLSNVAGYDALANRELERLEAEQRAKEEALKKKQDAKRMAENMKKQKDALRRKKQFENQNKVTNIMETARHSDYGYAIVHSAKGATWKDHKYIRKEGNRYIYKEDVGDTNRGKASDLERARAIARMTTGKKVGDTTRSVKNAGGKTNTKGYAYDFSGKNDKSKQPQKIDNRKNNAHSTKEQSIISKLSDANYRDTIDGIQYYKNPDSKEQTVIYTDKKGRRKTKTVTPNAFIGVTKDGRIVYVDKLPKKSLTDKLGFDERKALKEATNDAARAKELNQKTLAKGGDAKASTIYAINKQNQKEQAQKEYDRTDLAKAGKKVNETVENVGKAVSDSADKAKKLIKKAFRHSDMYGIDYGYAIVHSAKGNTWKKHKYIRKEGNRYIYKEDVGDTNRGKASDLERARAIAGMTSGKKVGDTSRSLKNNPAGYAHDYSGNKDESNNRINANLSRALANTKKYDGLNIRRTLELLQNNSHSYIGTLKGSEYYKNPFYNSKATGDSVGRYEYIKIDSDGTLNYTSSTPEEDKTLSQKIGLDQRKESKKAESQASAARDIYRGLNTYITPREFGTSLDTIKNNGAGVDQYKNVLEADKRAKNAKAEYDTTPLGKAEKKVNEVKSDVKNAGKKASSTVKNTGKKVGSTLKDLEGKIVKETTTVTDTNGKVLGTYTKPSSFKDVGSVMKKNISSEIKNTGKKVGSVLSNVVTRKNTLDASKDSSNSKVKGILDDITKKNKEPHKAEDVVTVKKKKVKHSSEGTYLAHSYRVIRK